VVALGRGGGGVGEGRVFDDLRWSVHGEKSPCVAQRIRAAVSSALAGLRAAGRPCGLAGRLDSFRYAFWVV
jgi:hypothetical protein